jgi:hypothetical protein
MFAEYKARKAPWGKLGAQRAKGSKMALTRNFKETVNARFVRDPAFAKALLDETAALFLNGDPHTAPGHQLPADAVTEHKFPQTGPKFSRL